MQIKIKQIHQILIHLQQIFFLVCLDFQYMTLYGFKIYKINVNHIQRIYELLTSLNIPYQNNINLKSYLSQ